MKDHPRIWLTPDVMTRLRADYQANHPRVKELKRVCDQYLASPASSLVLQWCANYGLLYQLSGDRRYADKAISLIQAKVDQGMQAILADGPWGYELRNLFFGAALTWDWCYRALSAAQKAQWIPMMEQWCDWTWPETNPARKGIFGTDDPGNNYYHGFMMTWMMGLALEGDSAKAAGYVANARNKWLSRMRPYLDQVQNGGYNLEGSSYGAAGTDRRIMWYLMAHRDATGEDLLNVPDFDWPLDQFYTKLYMTTPDFAHNDCWGDQSRDAHAPLSDYDRTNALIALNNPVPFGLAQYWLARIKTGTPFKFSQWEKVLWSRDDVPAVDYTKALKTGYKSDGAGWMCSRSSWSTDASYVSMMAGEMHLDHQDRALLGFHLWRGKGWLTASAKLQANGILKAAELNNSFTVDGAGQKEPAKGTILGFEDNKDYSLMAAEAAAAYNWGHVTRLTLCERQLFFLKPHTLVIFDTLVSPTSAAVKTWHMNVDTPSFINGNASVVLTGGLRLLATHLLPLFAEPVAVAVGPVGKPKSWRVDVSSSTQATTQFLNVLESRAETEPPALPALPEMAPGITGALIGSTLVAFSTAPSPWEISTVASLLYVIGATADTVYTVTEPQGAALPVKSQHVTASAAGVLTIKGQVAGMRAVRIMAS